MSAQEHTCRPLWTGPGHAPICVASDHFGQPINPHAAPAKCCAISTPHRHRQGGTR